MLARHWAHSLFLCLAFMVSRFCLPRHPCQTPGALSVSCKSWGTRALSALQLKPAVLPTQQTVCELRGLASLLCFTLLSLLLVVLGCARSSVRPEVLVARPQVRKAFLRSSSEQKQQWVGAGSPCAADSCCEPSLCISWRPCGRGHPTSPVPQRVLVTRYRQLSALREHFHRHAPTSSSLPPTRSSCSQRAGLGFSSSLYKPAFVHLV